MTISIFILFMFFIMMFIVYFDYISSIASLSLCLCINSYSAHSDVYGVGGRHYVSVVLIRCLPVDTPYILGHVVHHASNTPIESFVVYSPNIAACRVLLQRYNELYPQSSLVISLLCRYEMILAMITRCNCTNQMYALICN